MLSRIRIAPLLAAALALLSMAACNGGDEGEAEPQTPTPTQAETETPTPNGADEGPGIRRIEPAELPTVLRKSIASFQEDVQSLQAMMEFNLTSADFVEDAEVDTVHAAADQAHAKMNFTELGSAEVLTHGSDIYLNFLETGWVMAAEDDLEELGLDAATYRSFLNNPGLFDYETLVTSLGAAPPPELDVDDLSDLPDAEDIESLEDLSELLGGLSEGTPGPGEEAEEGGSIEDLGEQTVDGGTYRHFRGGLEFADWLAAYDDPSGADEILFPPDTTGVLTFDIWIDPDTLLPWKLAGTGDLSEQGFDMKFDFSVTLLSYNEPLEIPDAPEDAMTVSEYLSAR